MNEKPNLAMQVIKDMLKSGRWCILLSILIIFTALSVVSVTHKTRLIVSQHDKLRKERSELEVEKNNIILEEHTLSEHSRIEALAREKLGMVRPDDQHEKIVSQ